MTNPSGVIGRRGGWRLIFFGEFAELDKTDEDRDDDETVRYREQKHFLACLHECSGMEHRAFLPF
jgi:hypothetical protein